MHYIFSSDFIFWTEVANHDNIKNELLPVIKQNLSKTENSHANFWLCDVNTEYFSKETNKNSKYIDLIIGEIYPALDKLFEEVPLFVPKTSTVTDIWYNHYESGDGQEVHTHSGKNNTISGIYLLQLQEENKTVFYQTSHYTQLFKATKQTTEVKEGSIILFPSHLLHYVLKCEKERTTIAFNVCCTF